MSYRISICIVFALLGSCSCCYLTPSSACFFSGHSYITVTPFLQISYTDNMQEFYIFVCFLRKKRSENFRFFFGRIIDGRENRGQLQLSVGIKVVGRVHGRQKPRPHLVYASTARGIIPAKPQVQQYRRMFRIRLLQNHQNRQKFQQRFLLSLRLEFSHLTEHL